jgi:hypothetical protein
MLLAFLWTIVYIVQMTSQPHDSDIAGLITTLQLARDKAMTEFRTADATLRGIEQAILALQAPAPRTEYAGMGIIEAAKRFLKETAEPQATRQIANGLRKRGLTTKSAKFVATVYATLRNSREFTRLGTGRDGVWILTT